MSVDVLKDGATYVKPRWDEMNLSKANPISPRTGAFGFRHSASMS